MAQATAYDSSMIIDIIDNPRYAQEEVPHVD